MNRKNALKAIGATIAGAVLSTYMKTEAKADEKITIPYIVLPELTLNEDILITMQRDLLRALKKPLAERKWSMTIDLRKCIGCHGCTVGCIAENRLPPGVIYRPVKEESAGKYPNLTAKFIPKPCFQCDNPACVAACPVKATFKREDGVVIIDYDKCIGCKYCIVACPYGSRSSDPGKYYTDGTPELQAYEKKASFEYGKRWEKKTRHTSPIGNARKCHFCMHRVEAGLLPMCVTTCIGRATYFGDVNDSENTISKVTAKPNAFKYKEELGTKPSVTYLM